MREVWKFIEGYEGLYEVSNYGKILSLARKDSRGANVSQRIMKQNKNKKGYLSVGLCKDRFQIPCRVNRLVAEAFIPNPENKPEVNHKDGVKDNNRVENLEWVTHQENIDHAVKNHLIPRGEDSHKTNLTDRDVSRIRDYLKDGSYSIKQIAAIFNTTQKAVSLISLGKSWKHLLKEDDKPVGGHRRPKGSKNPASKLTEEDVKKIQILAYDGKVKQRDIGKMFGVDHAVIGRIRNGTAWTHILDKSLIVKPNKDNEGENNNASKLNIIKVQEIKLLLIEGEMTQKEIGAKFGVHQTTIRDIKNGKIWKHVK